MRDLDPIALDCLAALADERGFERAAQRLAFTQSAVSQRLRALETGLGRLLVVRSRPLRLTEPGRLLLRYARQLQALRADLQPLAEVDPVGPRSIPIAVNADSLATWFLPALTGFAVQAPALMQVSVDDEGHTAEWLRSGAVLAAVTAVEQPASGCSVRPLGALRYVAAASPAYMARHFAAGVSAGSLAQAPSLVFNTKDELQARWVRRLCHRHVELPRHMLPSSQAFVTAALAGMGWGLHPEALVDRHLADGSLVELVPGTPLDVPLYWQSARAASLLLDGLARQLHAAARAGLRPL